MTYKTPASFSQAPQRIVHPEKEKAAFAADIMQGLQKTAKSLSSKYFYDGTGSRLFRKIMDLPEYYLTRTETEIFENQKTAIILACAQAGENFELVDLGAGDAAKTRILLREALRQNHQFTYIPIDISASAMQDLSRDLSLEIPDLQMAPLASEYFAALGWLQKNKPERKVVLFLGSNIGNFENKAIRHFAGRLRRYLNPGDQVLMGFDLRKDPHLIRRAYDDEAGVTAAFNFNLLHRINLEFEGNIAVAQFQHFAEYSPGTGDMKSYLLTEKSQEITLKQLNFQVKLEAWEPIHTETSHKFTLLEIKEIGRQAGFRIKEVFMDQKHYFADVLFDVT